mmetsp:Transcript_51555/g.165067  ORF Transcript_51555/g.165067 Transcript_51555/m.165067 type:complete len:259 (+) Transcript_51555:649-1425(+)
MKSGFGATDVLAGAGGSAMPRGRQWSHRSRSRHNRPRSNEDSGSADSAGGNVAGGPDFMAGGSPLRDARGPGMFGNNFQRYLGWQRTTPIRKGETVEGHVTGYWKQSCLVDVGTAVPGVLRMEDFEEGYPLFGWPLALGSEVKAQVVDMTRKYYNLSKRPGTLERRRRGPLKEKPDISAFTDVPTDQWLEGEVVGMTMQGVFIRVSPPAGGQPADGLLRREEIEEATAKYLGMGATARVRVSQVDVDRGRMLLSMRAP